MPQESRDFGGIATRTSLDLRQIRFEMSENRQGGDWRRWLKPLGLLAAILAISALHYATNPSHIVQHEIYRYLYYVPIILGAYWYGVWGGLLTALGGSLAYIPHIRDAWAPNVPYTVNQYAQVVVFHLLGLCVGLLASFQRRLAERSRDAAASLERANRELRESQEQLRRADRLSALGEVAAGLAHEIRNPLAGVKGRWRSWRLGFKAERPRRSLRASPRGN